MMCIKLMIFAIHEDSVLKTARMV